MVVAVNGTGIGSRIKCLISAMRLAKTRETDYGIFWIRNFHVQCDWDSLFENRIEVKTIPENAEQWTQWRWYTKADDGIEKIDWLFEGVPQNTIDEYMQYCQKLTPVKYIRKKRDAAIQMAKEAGMSVCLRSWWETRVKKVPRRFKFSEAIGKIDSVVKDKFYFTTDNEAVFRKIIKRYGKRVLYHPKRTKWGDRYSNEGVQDILVDLFAAGHANEMLISKESGFTEMQWWFGGCQAKVTQMCPWR